MMRFTPSWRADGAVARIRGALPDAGWTRSIHGWSLRIARLPGSRACAATAQMSAPRPSAIPAGAIHVAFTWRVGDFRAVCLTTHKSYMHTTPLNSKERRRTAYREGIAQLHSTRP